MEASGRLADPTWSEDRIRNIGWQFIGPRVSDRRERETVICNYVRHPVAKLWNYTGLEYLPLN